MGACRSVHVNDGQERNQEPSFGQSRSQSSQRVEPKVPRAGQAQSQGTGVQAQVARPDPLQASRDAASPSDIWLQASFELQLRRLCREHPYLESGRSVQPHPLQNWVLRCRDSLVMNRYRQAQEHLRHIITGLTAERRPILETFRRFDVDRSGHLDAGEFANMCAYLGWGEEKGEMMDLDRDGRVTVQDMVAFVGYMGGVQQLLEKRRLRITRSRKDVCDYSGISVGAHVRAYFYVRGQKSQTWREAVVREVGVARQRGGEAGPATLGASLEFMIGAGGPTRSCWRRFKQVVPMSWVIGGVEDTSVAASLREVGILDDQQCFWAVLLPDSEMHAMRLLESNQRAALALIRRQSSESHSKASADVRRRFAKLGFGERELQAVQGWVQDLAPIIIHVDMDDCGHFFETDDFYRSQFETKTGKGAGEDYKTNSVRKGWEHDLFGGLYDSAKPFERVKYGALDIMNDFRGVASARRYGDSYLVLKDVRLRCTFTAADSAGLTVKRLGVLDKYLHVLEEYSDEELRNLVKVAMAAIAPEQVGGFPTTGAAELQLLRGTTEDSTRDWVTKGFPGLKQKSGKYYFEVQLEEGCSAPQVGLLSSKFVKSLNTASAQGVGDDDQGWAVDGQHAARWHAGCNKAWDATWPSVGTGSDARLKERVVVGVAVDLDAREVLVSTNGIWDKSPAFGPDAIPKGAALYPAVSLKGRAEFVFGPTFRNSPPGAGGFAQWPSTPGGMVKVDCPELGNSETLKIYKEVQIHGELSLKRNVQRLVASSKYREKPKTKRSYSLTAFGAGPCSGTYHRMGAHAEMPLYKSETGGVIYWDPEAALWKMNDTEDVSKFLVSAPPIQGSTGDVPREGWRVPDDWQGSLEAELFKSVLVQQGVHSDDAQRLAQTLASASDSGFVTKALDGGSRSLVEEWKHLKDPPMSADDMWEVALKEAQQHCLREAGLPVNAHVVETSHPYEAKRTSWKRDIEIKGAKALSVYFASKTCTRDRRTKFSIHAGGLDRDAAGPGARVELQVLGNAGKVTGTLVERLSGGEAWRVRLDRQTAEEPPPNAGCEEEERRVRVGDVVEAQLLNSTWYKAKVLDMMYKVDWYEGTRTPSLYTIEWSDGDPQDCEKTHDKIRQPQPPGIAKMQLEGLPRHRLVPRDPGEASYAVCSESPKAAMVAYTGKGKAKGSGTVGDEIMSFNLDRSQPLTPVSVGSFVGPGPAQAKGVKVGWFLDLVGSVMGKSREAWVQLLAGLAGGVQPHPKEGTGDKQMQKLLDAAFCDLEGLLERLNGPLRALTDVQLVFANGASLQPAKLLPLVQVAYEGGARVGSEIQLFKTSGKKVQPAGFLKPGPAQQAGVRTDWVLELAATRELNPAHSAALTEDAVLGNPNTLLAIGDVKLVFKQPNLKKTVQFEGSGPADSEKWRCGELPGSSALFEFTSDGDGAGEASARWGVWALVLSKDAPAPSLQTVDSLAERWVQATRKARGCAEKPRVERDGWDESRLRALCARHGWEFEWMTEDGERRRRAHERQGFFLASGQLANATEVADAAAATSAEAAAEPAASAAAGRVSGAAGAAGAAETGEAKDRGGAEVLGQGEASPVVLAGPVTDLAATEAPRAPEGGNGDFQLMTFNVEEYYHGHKSGTVAETVFNNLKGIRTIIEQHMPDVLCLQEHSLGKHGSFTEKDIMNALFEGLDYAHVSQPTGEAHAWFSALANVVAWRQERFQMGRSWRVELSAAGEAVPGTSQPCTPRAATCVELKHLRSSKSLVVCSTHLMGGRFEDKSFIAESVCGRCVRAEQAEKIASSIKKTCGAAMPSLIAGDFNVMHHGYKQGPFREAAKKYFEQKLLADALSEARPAANGDLNAEDYSFDGFYVPFQTKVHQALDRKLGYVCAYGRNDAVAEMKTTTYAGCIDWVYTRQLISSKNERVVSALAEGYSDHNAVVVNLQLP